MLVPQIHMLCESGQTPWASLNGFLPCKVGWWFLIPGLGVGFEETVYVLGKCWVSNVYSQALWPPNHYYWLGTVLGHPWLSNPSLAVILTKDGDHPKAVSSTRPRRWPRREVGQPYPAQAAVE